MQVGHIDIVGVLGCLSDRLALSPCWRGRHNVPVEHIKGFAVGTSIVLVMADMYAMFPFLQVLWHFEESMATTAVSASPTFSIPSRCVCVQGRRQLCKSWGAGMLLSV